MTMPSVRATRSALTPGAQIAESAVLAADVVSVGAGATIEDGVTILADRIDIAEGSRIGRDTKIVSPEVCIGQGTTVGSGCRIELNEHLRIGRLGQVGDRLRAIGQGLTVGERLWMTDDVVIGGGGARASDAYLTIGDRSAVMDGCFINVCRRVSIGHDTALSNRVTILTHTLWHDALAGGNPIAAPVAIGDDVIVFVNAVVAPGVTIGSHSSVAANALVLGEVPENSLAVGNPARVVRGAPGYPKQLSAERRHEIVREALAAYVAELPVKGLTGELHGPDVLVVRAANWIERVGFFAAASPGGGPFDVTMSFVAVPPPERGRCHFDLGSGTLVGAPTRISEDLRDFLRRRAIRVLGDRPFSSLPQAHITRLKARLT
jgi:acetyltransferase-like isoleucine patch superfamily enzyme